MTNRVWLAALATVFLTTGAPAADEVKGPVEGKVIRTIDGDTFEFAAHVWLGLDLTTHVRIRGIDTPEVRGACQAEKDMAARAARRLAEIVASGITITNISDDKYFGRVIADVRAANGTDVGAAMIASGLARLYDGGTRLPWCAVVAAGR